MNQGQQSQQAGGNAATMARPGVASSQAPSDQAALAIGQQIPVDLPEDAQDRLAYGLRRVAAWARRQTQIHETDREALDAIRTNADACLENLKTAYALFMDVQKHVGDGSIMFSDTGTKLCAALADVANLFPVCITEARVAIHGVNQRLAEGKRSLAIAQLAEKDPGLVEYDAFIAMDRESERRAINTRTAIGGIKQLSFGRSGEQSGETGTLARDLRQELTGMLREFAPAGSGDTGDEPAGRGTVATPHAIASRTKAPLPASPGASSHA